VDVGSDDGHAEGLESGSDDADFTMDDGDTAAPEDSSWGDGAASCFPDDTGAGCGSFLGCDDVESPGPLHCDHWAQDCPPGEKCTPIASTPGSGAWDANVCVPAGAQGVGEPCELADGPLGTDTCDEESMCYDIDAQTGIGVCIGFCLGSEASPTCSEESVGATCRQNGAGILNLCLPACNPLLAGECPSGQNCTAAFEGQDLQGFTCFPPAAEALSGEECDCANCCAAGHMCVQAAEYGPDCAFDLCCTRYCDTDDPTPQCDGTDQVCVPLFPPDTPEVGDVGHCVVP